MKITWLPVYEPSEQEVADAGLYALNVGRVLSAALGVPQLGCGPPDKRDLHEAIRSGVVSSWDFGGHWEAIRQHRQQCYPQQTA